MTASPGIVVTARFPFGRYAATPWFRSRREHVGNVEWPPSPWRIVRALVASAYATGDADLADRAAAIVKRLATVEPRYSLPPVGEIVYAQWMPQLNFDDSPGAKQRSENGHTLLAVSPDRQLTIHWPGLDLDAEERRVLGELLGNLRYLGQSVSVCELSLLGQLPQKAGDEGEAIPSTTDREGEAPQDAVRETIVLLAPQPEVTLDQLQVSTGDRLLKAMPAPPGSRWVEYTRITPQARQRPARPRAIGLVYRLEGPLRPPVASPLRPDIGRSSRQRPEGPTLEQLVRRACRWTGPLTSLTPIDDDGDGRAERLGLVLSNAQPLSILGPLLEPSDRLRGPGIDCALRLERVDWAGSQDPAFMAGSKQELLLFSLVSERRPLLADALVVAETFRRRLLGVARRRFGGEAIPTRLSGRDPTGQPVLDDHAHAHFLLTSRDGVEVDALAIWCPTGFDRSEAAAINATTLPALCGAPIRLIPTEENPLAGPARRWTSHTPFLLVRHPKRRGGTVSYSPDQQVVDELERRDLPKPSRIEPLPGRWDSFRILRRAKQGCFPALGLHGFELEFAEPVQGPVALGRNSHFGMGLFLPITDA